MDKQKKLFWKFLEPLFVIVILVSFAIIMVSLSYLPWKPYQKYEPDLYEGIVCMHGVSVKEADGDAAHICEHMDILRYEKRYTPVYNYTEPQKVEIDEEHVKIARELISAIESCQESTYIFELSENDIEDWSTFEEEIRVVCADFYPVNYMITDMLGTTWRTEASGRSYIELDVEHCKNVIALCRQESGRIAITKAALQEDVIWMGLNGYLIHDLKAVYDYVCKNATYDWNLQNTTPYEFFTESSVQCAGYARTYQMICDYIGFDVKYVSGYVGTELHAWNSIVIGGETYYIDCTFGDTDDENISYEYFLTKEPTGVIDNGELIVPETTEPENTTDSTEIEQEVDVTEPIQSEVVVDEEQYVSEELTDVKETVPPTKPQETKPEKPVVTFTEVDEYLYVANTDTLNVRKGPGTEYEKVTSISLNTKIHRIGKGSNGWSKIDYNGQVLYVASNYLSYEETHVETVAEEMLRRGNIGRLTIPSVGVNVALFETTLYNSGHSQPIVDASDSAAYMPDSIEYYGFAIIGDHVHQGFSSIKKSVPGTTYAYVDNGVSTTAYVCTDKFVGYNGYGGIGGLFDVGGNTLAGKNDGGICMYTCNVDGTITITFWQSV